MENIQEIIQNIINLSGELHNKFPHLRYGQCIFNDFYEVFPREANQLRGTEYDCFYITERVPSFIHEISKLINGKENLPVQQ